MTNSEIILVTINGEDKPGVTAGLTQVLANHDAFILDIGQADIHRNLSLGILFKTKEGVGGDILKDLLLKAYELDINIRFTPISNERYSNWVKMQGKNRFIITLLGRVLTAKQIAAVAEIISEQGLNIDNITRLTNLLALP
ncbi:MAG TPA: ACT domain-containing protein [Dysgonamonadaceae bacterium]|nr:ACT domain-containing protein [Dysgonamonadaceae bacterium]